MKNTILLFLSLLACILSACHKDQPPTPTPRPCADMLTDTSQLSPKWTFTDRYIYSIYPAIFDQQVIFSRYKSEDATELLGFDGGSGQLLWQKVVPQGQLYNRRYRQLGSKLYFTGGRQAILFSFDLATQQLDTVATLPSSGYFYADFAIWQGFAVCSSFRSLSNNDSLEVSSYLVNLQTGQSRKVLRYVNQNVSNLSGLFDPQVTVTTDGDTLFRFVKADYDPSIYSFVAQLVSLNISTGVSVESDVVRKAYESNQGSLVVEGNRAWWLVGNQLQCLDISTGVIIWKEVSDELYGANLVVRQGKAFVAGNSFMKAFDANNGMHIWSQYADLYSEDISDSFIRNGKLFVVQGLYLITLDLEAGCVVGRQVLPPGLNIGLQSMTTSLDGQSIYLLSFENFFAVSVPQ